MTDTHCHLTDEVFEKDREEVIKRAFSSGISKMIDISYSPLLWSKSLELSEKFENVFCAVGIHPNDKGNFSDFSELLNNKKVVAVGECGLDYYRDPVPKKEQMEKFEKQLEIAKNFNKPVIVHCRNAEEDIYKILKKHTLKRLSDNSHSERKRRNYSDETLHSVQGDNGVVGYPLKGVVHCFSSTKEYAFKFLDLGFYIGIDGPVTYPNAKSLRETAKEIPLDKILLETDSPYLPPQKFRGKRNEPSYLKYIAEELAQIKNISFEDVSNITDNNSKELFGISPALPVRMPNIMEGLGNGQKGRAG